LSEGRFAEAKDLQKVSNTYYKSAGQAKQTEAGLEQQRSALSDSIVRHGKQLLG
jgi:hypothetical protein